MANEKRLIDANPLIERLQKSHEYHARNSREEVLLYRDIRIINEQPTVDAVEVVRCMNCKCYQHDDLYEGEFKFCENIYGLENPDPDDFCSHGERKEDNG